MSSSLLAAGIVGSALLFSSQRAAAPTLARTAPPGVLRAEDPSDVVMQRAPSRIEERTSAKLTPIPSASNTRAAKPTVSPSAAPVPAAPVPAAPVKAAGSASASAQPTLQAMPVASTKREPTRRASRAERSRRASRPAPALPEELTRAQVIAAMRKITPAVNACFGSTHGKASVAFSVVGKTGRVVGARVTGKTGKVGSCIARSVRRARFPKFAKSRLEITYPFAR